MITHRPTVITDHVTVMITNKKYVTFDDFESLAHGASCLDRYSRLCVLAPFDPQQRNSAW